MDVRARIGPTNRGFADLSAIECGLLFYNRRMTIGGLGNGA